MPDVLPRKPRNKGVAGFCRRVLLSAVVACGVAELPAVLHGAAIFWLWGLLAAVVGSLAAVQPHALRRAGCHSWQAWWMCALAIGVGVTIDFFALPPYLMLSMCRNAGEIDFGLVAIIAHIRLLPATSTAMCLVIAFTEYGTYKCVMPTWGSLPLVRALYRKTLHFIAMMSAMAFSVEAFKAMANGSHLPWTADCMCVAMLTGMYLVAILQQGYVVGSARLLEIWQHI